MKSIFYQFRILFLSGIVSGLTCCVNESDDDFFRADGGTISGTVLYRDYFTNQLTIASGAEIIISIDTTDKKDNKIKGKYELEADENGEFEVNFLRSGGYKYNVKIAYTVPDDNRGSLSYLHNKEVPIPLENESFILALDPDQDYSLSSLSGRVLFSDELSDLSQVASGVEVRLKSESTKAIFTDSTNGNGNFTISNLSQDSYDLNITYYQDVGSSEPLVYQLNNDSVQIPRNDEKSIDPRILQLSDKDLINSFVKVKVLKESNNERIPNAKVYLSKKEFDKNNLDISIAIDSTETNQRGIALFGNLEGGEITYYTYTSASDSYGLNPDTLIVGMNEMSKFYEREIKLTRP